jgi:large subunit ribosomal protein L24
MKKTKIRKNDEVKVMAGKETGKQGKVLEVDAKNGRVIIEGLNMVKKAMRKTQKNQKGGIAEVEASLNLSNVMVVCRKCGPTRVGYKTEGKSKSRICRKCGEAL